MAFAGVLAMLLFALPAACPPVILVPGNSDARIDFLICQNERLKLKKIQGEIERRLYLF